MKRVFSRQIFEKYSNIKFHENPYSGSRVVCSMRRDRRTDLTKLIVTSRNFAKALKIVRKDAYSSNVYCTLLSDCMLCVALNSPSSHAHHVATSDCRKLNEEVLDDF